MLPPSPDDEWLQDEEWPQANDLDDPLYAIMADFYASASQALGDFDRKFSYYFPSLNRIVNQEIGFNGQLLTGNSLEDLRYLLQTRQVDPSYNVRGWNALSFAAIRRSDSQKDFLSLLLQYNVPVNSQAIEYCLRTPLHLLIYNDNPEVAVFFIQEAKRLKRVIHFTIPDRDGCTTLLFASKKGCEEVALCILEQNPEPGIFMNLQDDEGKTALDYAQSLGQTRLIRALLNVEVQSKVDEASLDSKKKCYTPRFESAKLCADTDAYFINGSGKKDPTQIINVVNHQKLT